VTLTLLSSVKKLMLKLVFLIDIIHVLWCSRTVQWTDRWSTIHQHTLLFRSGGWQIQGLGPMPRFLMCWCWCGNVRQLPMPVFEMWHRQTIGPYSGILFSYNQYLQLRHDLFVFLSAAASLTCPFDLQSCMFAFVYINRSLHRSIQTLRIFAIVRRHCFWL